MSSIPEEWLIKISTPVYIVIIGVEILLSHLQHKKSYTVKNTFANIYLMLLNGGIDLAFRFISVAILQYFFINKLITWQNGFLYWFWTFFGYPDFF